MDKDEKRDRHNQGAYFLNNLKENFQNGTTIIIRKAITIVEKLIKGSQNYRYTLAISMADGLHSIYIHQIRSDLHR